MITLLKNGLVADFIGDETVVLTEHYDGIGIEMFVSSGDILELAALIPDSLSSLITP